MSFNWTDYLSLARELSESEINHLHEAKLRSSISRAYFSALNTTKTYLERLGHIFEPTKEVHQIVLNILYGSSNNNLMLLAQILARLRRYRNQVDYDNEVNELIDLTTTSIETTSNYLIKLDQIKAKSD